MPSCGIVIFHSSPTNNTSVKTALIISNIFTFFLFELLSVLAGVFFEKNYFTVFNTELIKSSSNFIELGQSFGGFLLLR